MCEKNLLSKLVLLVLLLHTMMGFSGDVASATQLTQVEIAAFVRDENVSSACLGTMESINGVNIYALEPEGDLLIAQVVPGDYAIQIFYIPDDIMGFHSAETELRVMASDTNTFSITLQSPYDEFSFDSPYDTEQDGDSDTVEDFPTDDNEGDWEEPWDDDDWDKGDWDEDDWDDDSDYDDRDSHSDEDRPQKTLGAVTVEWMVSCKASTSAIESATQYDPIGEEIANTFDNTQDQFAITYSGSYRWQVLDDRGMTLELDQGSGTVLLRAGGAGSREGYIKKESFCYDPVTNQSQERLLKEAVSGSWSHSYHAPTPSPLYVSISPDGWYDVLLWNSFFQAERVKTDGSITWVTQGCDGTDTFSSPVIVGSGAASTGECSLMLALMDRALTEQLEGEFDPTSGFRETIHYSKSFGPDDLGSTSSNNEFWTYKDRATITISMNISYVKEPSPFEVVIIPPNNYGEWLPRAGKDENSEGNGLIILAELRDKENPSAAPKEQAIFRFELHDTSQEPGICLNAPAKEMAKTSYDLKFDQEQPMVEVSDNGQIATTEEPSTSAAVQLLSYDWGSVGKLRVVATTESGDVIVGYVKDQPATEMLAIPVDENHNRVGDDWEKNNDIFSRQLEPEWDEAWEPRGQATAGDGISLYEKYRGFIFVDQHERLDPAKKYLFIRDPDGITQWALTDPIASTVGFKKASQLQVRFINEEQWTKEGWAEDDRRIINFNHGFGHAGEQYGLLVRKVDQLGFSTLGQQIVDHISASGAPPWLTQMIQQQATGILGLAWADWSVPSGQQLKHPRGTYRIEIFSKVIEKAIEEELKINLFSGPQFAAVQNPQALTADEWEILSDLVGSHMGTPDYNKRLALETSVTLSHELGHGVGVPHHTPQPENGNQQCVMCYHEALSPDHSDPFALIRRDPWPGIFCTNDDDCWSQIRIRYNPGN